MKTVLRSRQGKREDREVRIGFGYDIHRLEEGRKMFLGGVEIDFPKGFKGHSDGDVLLHAVSDSILGAIGKADIGVHFPDTSAEYKDIPSRKILEEVLGMMKDEGLKVVNLDCTVVMEEPKISHYRERIIEEVSKIMGIDKERINLKGKTKEALGETGRGEAAESFAAVLLD